MLAIDTIATLAVHSSRLTNDHETEEDRCGSTALESATRTNEQTSADGTTPIECQSVRWRVSCECNIQYSHGNHLHMSALKTLVQFVRALSQALAVGRVGRAIVELLLAERGTGLCVHRGEMLLLCSGRAWSRTGEFANARGQSKTMRGVEGRPSLMKRDLGARQARPCLAMHCDKLVAGWLQGMLP